MEILKGYGLRTNLQRLLHRFWDDQAVVLKTGRYYGRPFRTERGVTQGGPPPPTTVFNIVVDAVVREVMMEV